MLRITSYKGRVQMLKNSNFKIALYIRVSTEEQALNPEGSIKSQEQRLREAVKWKNRQSTFGEIAGIYVDAGISAKDMRRPKLQAMLRDVRAGKVNLIMVTEISRLSRNNRDFLNMWDMMSEHKCSFMSLREDFDTTTAAGEMLMFQLMNFAQFERKQTSERVAANMLSRASRGLYNGGSVPLGYKLDPAKPGYLDVDQEQAAIVNTAFKVYLQEGNLSQTARWLNDRGYKICNHKQGGGNMMRLGHFTVDGLCRLLKNKAYIGIKVYTQKGESKEVKAVWDAIVDPATFQKVGEQLAKNHHKLKKLRGKNPFPYLLSGVSFCMSCGDHMPGKSATGRIGKVAYYEHCGAAKRESTLKEKLCKCFPYRVLAKKIEPLVWSEFCKFLEDEKFVLSLMNKARQMHEAQDEHKERRRLKAKLAGFNSQLEALAERIAILPKTVSPVPLFNQMEKLEMAKVEVEEKLLKVKEQNIEQRLVPLATLEQFTEFAKTTLKKNADFLLKRRIMQKIIQRIEIGEESIRIVWNLDKDHYNRENRFLSEQILLAKEGKRLLSAFKDFGSSTLTNGHPTRT